MTAEEYRDAHAHVVALADLLEQMPLADMAACQARAEALGPVLDPTLYRSRADAFHVDQDRVRILRRAQIALQQLRATHEQRPGR